MKFSFLILFASLLAFTNPEAEVTKKKADVKASKIEWKGYKVTGKHHGTVNLKSGELVFTDGQLTGGNFVIDMTSITVGDLEGEYKGKLEGHLKSDDFFGVKNHPTASLEFTQVVSRGTPGDYKIVADLTIKDITKEIKFLAHVEEESATAEITVDRSEYSVRYGSGSFFDDLGDKTIYDEFDLKVNLVLSVN